MDIQAILVERGRVAGWLLVLLSRPHDAGPLPGWSDEVCFQCERFVRLDRELDVARAAHGDGPPRASVADLFDDELADLLGDGLPL